MVFRFVLQIQVPAPTGLVNDFANVLTAESADLMTRIAADVRAKSRGELTIVTLPDLDGRLHQLGEWHGRKKLLVAFASW